MPLNIEKIVMIINSEYHAIGQPEPDVFFNKKLASHSNLLNDLLIVKVNDEMQAWLSFHKMHSEYFNSTYEYLAGINTKNSIKHAAILACALCDHANSIIFNDSGIFSLKEAYSSNELRKLISIHNN